jgi:hypothetical protein
MPIVSIEADRVTALRAFQCEAGDQLVVFNGLVLGVDKGPVLTAEKPASEAVAAPEEPVPAPEEPPAPPPATRPITTPPLPRRAGRLAKKPAAATAAPAAQQVTNSEAAATEMLAVLRAAGPGEPIKMSEIYQDKRLTSSRYLRWRARQILEERGHVRSSGKGFGMRVELLPNAPSSGHNGVGAAA